MRQIETVYNNLSESEKTDFLRAKSKSLVPHFSGQKPNNPNFPCGQCAALRPTGSGHDPCIANLPGVKNACCGHGGWGYVQFESGLIIRGFFEFPCGSTND